MSTNLGQRSVGCKSIYCEYCNCNGNGFHFAKTVDTLCKTCDGMGRRAIDGKGQVMTFCETCVLQNAPDHLCHLCNGAGWLRRTGPACHKVNLLQDARVGTCVSQPEIIKLLRLAGVPLRREVWVVEKAGYVPKSGLSRDVRHYGPGLMIRIATMLHNMKVQEEDAAQPRFEAKKQTHRRGGPLNRYVFFEAWDLGSTVSPWTTEEMSDLLRELWASMEWRRWFHCARSFVDTDFGRLQAWSDECTQWRTDRRGSHPVANVPTHIVLS